MRPRFVVLHQHQIRIVSLETVLHALEEFYLQLDASRNALLGQHLQGGERRLERKNAVDDDREACFPSFRELARQRLERHRMGEYSLAFRQYRLSGRRQPNAIPVSIQQLEAQLPLELSQLIADGRLNAMQLLGGG